MERATVFLFDSYVTQVWGKWHLSWILKLKKLHCTPLMNNTETKMADKLTYSNFSTLS